MERLISIGELAQLKAVSVDTIRRWEKNGKIESVRTCKLANRGIELITVNPAFTSIIGLFKYLKMYGLACDEAAALVIARRGMRLDEKLPDSITAYVEVNSNKHVWGQWAQLNRQTKQSGMVNRRHDYYTVSNWSFLVNPKEVCGEAFAH